MQRRHTLIAGFGVALADAVASAGVNDTYTIHVVYWTVAALDPYHGVASAEAIPVTTAATRTASIVTGSKTGISFSHSRTVYAFGAGQDVEPNVRVDYQGNAYVGGIRGLAGGNDLWRFDLNPKSPTYDPLLLAANPVWCADGTVDNPAWKGQPDALAPNNESELGGDGGGDMDLAVGFKPAVPSAMPPILATSSLVAANVSTQRSTDRGDTLTQHGAIKTGTVLMGLRGSATVDRVTAAGLVGVGLSDSTRGGGTFTMGSCPQ